MCHIWYKRALATGSTAAAAMRAGTGAFVSMTIISWPLALGVPGADSVLLFASFGSSTCLLHVAPMSPFSRPRAVVLGHTVSALSGCAAGTMVAALGAAPAYAAPAAVALAVGSMVAARCEHPPAAGTAITAALSPLGVGVVAPFVCGQAALIVLTFALGRLVAVGGPGSETYVKESAPWSVAALALAFYGMMMWEVRTVPHTPTSQLP